MSDELKPCWMCGSPAIKYWEGDSNCTCGNKDCYLYMDFMPIERWNKRFIEDALRSELDACKSVLADAETQRDMNDAEIDTLLKQLYDARYEANLANRGHDWENSSLLFAIMRNLGIHSTSPTMGCWCEPEIEKKGKGAS